MLCPENDVLIMEHEYWYNTDLSVHKNKETFYTQNQTLTTRLFQKLKKNNVQQNANILT